MTLDELIPPWLALRVWYGGHTRVCVNDDGVVMDLWSMPFLEEDDHGERRIELRGWDEGEGSDAS